MVVSRNLHTALEGDNDHGWESVRDGYVQEVGDTG